MARAYRYVCEHINCLLHPNHVCFATPHPALPHPLLMNPRARRRDTRLPMQAAGYICFSNLGAVAGAALGMAAARRWKS